MGTPVLPAAVQSADTGSRISELASRKGNTSLQETPESGSNVASFLQLLQGAADPEGSQEPGEGEQAQASLSLQLLAVLFQLDPSQLAEQVQAAEQAGTNVSDASLSGEGDGILSLLQDMSQGGKKQKALLRLLSGEGISAGSQQKTGLGGIPGQAQGEQGGDRQLLSRLVSLLEETTGETKRSASSGQQPSRELQELLAETQGKRGSSDVAQQDLNRLFRLLSPGQGKGDNGQGQSQHSASRANPLAQLVSALREASSQGRLSGQQLERIVQDLEQVSTRASQESSGQAALHKTGEEAKQLGRLAAVLQQFREGGDQSGKATVASQQGSGEKGQSEVNLVRLFMQSFDRGGSQGQSKVGSSSPDKGGQDLLSMDKFSTQSLLKQGQSQAKGTEISPAPASARSESSNPGVSAKAGEWGTLLSTLRGAAEGGGAAGAAARGGQPSGTSSMMDNQVLQQVVSKFQTELQRGSRRINVRMHPPELGRVELKLVSEDSNMRVQLQVQNTQVQGILERNMPALRQALEQQGLDFDSIQVSVESGQQEGSGRNAGESDHPRPGEWGRYPEAEAAEDTSYQPVEASAEHGGISLRV